MRNYTTCILLLASTLAFGSCEQLDTAAVQKIIDNDRALYNIPAVQLSIRCSDDNKSYDFVSGKVTLEGEEAVTSEHLFQIGSQTKSFVAVILLQLEAEGRLSLKDHLGKSLPNIAPSWREITIEQLLNHTSGLYNYTDELSARIRSDKDYDLQKEWTADELLAIAEKYPAYFKPGQGWHYSNTNYVLAGMIIEAITGNPVKEELENRLFVPLSLYKTAYINNVYNPETMQQMAHGYSANGLFPTDPTDVTAISPSWANSAGAIVSTSADTASWVKQLSHGNVLPVAQLLEFTQLVDENTGLPVSASSEVHGYGMGVRHDFTTFGSEAWWHSGSTLGYTSLMIWLKNSDVVITANLSHVGETTKNGRDSNVLVNDVIRLMEQD